MCIDESKPEAPMVRTLWFGRPNYTKGIFTIDTW